MPPDDDVRKPMPAPVTPDAHNGWKEWAARQNASLTALLEVLGLALDDGRLDLELDDDLVDEARELDRQRRRRAPDRD